MKPDRSICLAFLHLAVLNLITLENRRDLDPLNTYFIVSILANHAKKYNRIVLLTMEKPRSDIFPFLDRVTYLCLGDVVYTGATRMMLDYFRSIGFPCPELENPLMYYRKLIPWDNQYFENIVLLYSKAVVHNI